jgi:hypothetical protein
MSLRTLLIADESPSVNDMGDVPAACAAVMHRATDVGEPCDSVPVLSAVVPPIVPGDPVPVDVPPEP